MKTFNSNHMIFDETGNINFAPIDEEIEPLICHNCGEEIEWGEEIHDGSYIFCKSCKKILDNES